MHKAKDKAVWLAFVLGVKPSLVYAKECLPHSPAELTKDPHYVVRQILMVIRLVKFSMLWYTYTKKHG